MSLQPWLDAIASRDFVQETFRQVLLKHDGKIPGIDYTSSIAPTKQQLEIEYQSLTQSDVYSFSGFAQQAIEQAASGIPLDTVLTNDIVPRGGANWWYLDNSRMTFDGEPIAAILWSYCVHITSKDMEKVKVEEDEIESALRGEKMAKLTWEHDSEEPKFQLRVGIFVKDSRSNGLVLPASGWIWDSGFSIAHQIKATIDSYPRTHDATLANTVQAVREVTQFIIAAQTWMQQEILETRPMKLKTTMAGASRSEKKKAPSRTLQIVQLRKKHIIDADRKPSQTDREWQHQWVVNGHWRHQVHGVGRMQRKLIYVNSFVKGPDDKPFKPATKKVYAVLR